MPRKGDIYEKTMDEEHNKHDVDGGIAMFGNVCIYMG